MLLCPICDHSYLLLDCHRGSDDRVRGLSLLAKMKVLYQGLIKPHDKPFSLW